MNTSLFEDIRSLKDKVGHVLNKYPETRNSDELLIRKVCEIFNFDPVTKASAIERYRRWFNQPPRNLYLPTDWKVAKGRGIAEEVWREVLGYKGFLL